MLLKREKSKLWKLTKKKTEKLYTVASDRSFCYHRPSIITIDYSIYVSSWEDYHIAERLLRDAFNEAGLNPTFNSEYNEHLDDIV